jgi:histone acetyltransferase
MPRDYVTRLCFDSKHRVLAGVLNGNLVAAIVFAAFAGKKRPFIELVFCVVATRHQALGLGARMMAYFKTMARERYPDHALVLVYADNEARGFFRRQGFLTVPPMGDSEDLPPRKAWDVGALKHYDNATLMGLVIAPSVDYLNFPLHIAMQRAALAAKLRTLTHSHEVHASPFAPGTPHGAPMNMRALPGLRACGWDPAAWDATVSLQAQREVQARNAALLMAIEADPVLAAPFLAPVATLFPAEAKAYAAVVRDPIDLGTIRQRLAAGGYVSHAMLRADLERMVDNCLLFNTQDDSYFADVARRLRDTYLRAPAAADVMDTTD